VNNDSTNTNNGKKDDDVVVVPKIKQIQKLKTDIPVNHDIYQSFNEYLKIKYANNPEKIEKNKELEIDLIFKNGLYQAQELLDIGTTLLFKDRSPREDVLKKLGNIAYEFTMLSGYPNIAPRTLQKLINKILRKNDFRTIRDYKKCIISYSNKMNRFGILDVSMFVDLIPKQYVKEKSDFD